MHELYSARKHPEFVVLEIGEEIGALILHAGPEAHGLEIEIDPVDGSTPRTHTGVHERSTHAGSILTAIFGSLPAGDYVICDGGEQVTIRDGEVTELRL